jgi:hypothetical protein
MDFPPADAPQLPPMIGFRGDAISSTVAYIFHYPFKIWVTQEVAEALPHAVQVNGQMLTIYRPFQSRLDEKLPFVESIPMKNVPFRPGTVAPDFEWMITPTQATEQPQDYALRKDSLRIDCAKDLPYEFAAASAERFVSLIRYLTNQWWIKRGREHPRTNVRHWFNANTAGERLSSIGTFTFFYGKLGFERPVDVAIWEQAIATLCGGSRIPISWELFLDAVYFHASDELRRSVLELAISNELLVAETVEQWAATGKINEAKATQLLGGKDFLNHLSRVGREYGRSFQKEHAVEFDWVKAIWIARGKLAHGKEEIAHGNRRLMLDDGPSLFGSTIALRRWLGTLAPEQTAIA